jgi:hypothetical protein
MAKNVQLTVDIKGGDSVGKAAEKTKTLKQELRELKNELASGNLTGKAFDEATARAAKLSDTIIDVNNRVKALATDGADVVLRGFGDMATGIVGGFAAAQGAMALFGSENEDLQKTLVKLQGATALLNGLQQVNATLQGDSAAMVALNTAKTKILTFVQTRYAAAVGTSTGALKLMRIAGAALGIGLIVAAVGLLISNFGKIKKVVLDFIPGLSHLGELFTKVKNAVMDFVGISSEAERQEETAAKQRAVRSQQMKDEIELMEANGASARELYLAKRKLLFNDLETLKIAAFKKGATQDEIKAYNEMVQAIRVLDAEETTRIKEGAEKDKKASEDAAKKKKEANDKKAEEEKKHQEELKKIVEDEEEAKRLRGKSQFELELMELQKEAEKKQELLKGDLDAQKLIRENFEKDAAALNEKYAKEEAEKKKEKDKVLADLIEQRRVDDLSVRDKELNDIIDKYAKEAELAKGHADLLAEIETDKNKALADKKLEFAKQDAEAQKEIDNVRLDSMIATANQASQLLSAVAGKNKSVAMAALAVEKGAAIADVIIKGIRERAGITAKYALIPGGLALSQPELIASRIRTGLSVATIAATGIQGAKSIGNSGGSGGGSVQPPNIRGSQTTNEPTSQPATKVFVTETDIRSSLRKVDGIYTQSTIQ